MTEKRFHKDLMNQDEETIVVEGPQLVVMKNIDEVEKHVSTYSPHRVTTLVPYSADLRDKIVRMQNVYY